MPNTLIQIKRASTVTIPILDRGEPAIDFNSGILYVGDGVTNPGLSFLSSGASLAPHDIDGPNHSITSTVIGGTLRVPSANTFNISRLGYYDLGTSSGVNYTTAATDVTSSRLHWMDLEHVGKKPHCIFYTDLDYENEYHDMSHFPNTTGSNPTPTFGNKIYELSYENNTLVNKVLVSAKQSGGISFRQLTAADIDGISPSTEMTSLKGAYRSIFFTSGTSGLTNAVAALQYGYTTGSTARKYLQVNKGATLSASNLTFGPLSYDDLVGDFNFGSSTAQNNWTLRYNTATTAWQPVGWLKTIVDTATISGKTIVGITVDNSGTDSYSKIPKIELIDNSGAGSTNTLQAKLEITSVNAMRRSGEAPYLSAVPAKHGIVFSVTGSISTTTNGTVTTQAPAGLALAVTSDYKTQFPNMQFDHFGNINIWSPSTISSTKYGVADSGRADNHYGINFIEKVITFTTSSNASLAGYHVINSTSLNVVYDQVNASTITQLICGINLNNITMNTGAAGTEKRQGGRFFSCGILSTSASAHGIYIDTITTNHSGSGSRISSGIQINSVNSTVAGAGGANVSSSGLAVHTISSAGALAAGLCLGIDIRNQTNDGGISGFKDTYGLYISRVKNTDTANPSTYRAVGIRVNDVSSQCGHTYGLHMSNLKVTANNQAAYGILLTTLTGTSTSSNMFGATIYSLNQGVAVGDRRIMGLYVDATQASIAPMSTGSVTQGVRYGLYVCGDRNFISGTVSGTIIKGDVYLNSSTTDGVSPANLNSNYSGSTHVNNLYVHGTLVAKGSDVYFNVVDTSIPDLPYSYTGATGTTYVNNLNINGTLTLGTNSGLIKNGRTWINPSESDLDMANTEIQKYNVLYFYGTNSIKIETFDELGKGYDGQVITIIAQRNVAGGSGGAKIYLKSKKLQIPLGYQSNVELGNQKITYKGNTSSGFWLDNIVNPTTSELAINSDPNKPILEYIINPGDCVSFVYTETDPNDDINYLTSSGWYMIQAPVFTNTNFAPDLTV